MQQGGRRLLASEMRGGGGGGRGRDSGALEDGLPEWKKISQNKERSLGKRTNMSIKEQRESLGCLILNFKKKKNMKHI